MINRRMLITVLVAINVAVHMSGSTFVNGQDNPQDAIDKLNIENLEKDYDESLDFDIMRSASDTTVSNHFNNQFGLSKEDLENFDKGHYLAPEDGAGEEGGQLSPLELLSSQTRYGNELDMERRRARQALDITLESVAMQQYLDEFHKALEESYSEAKDRSEHLDTEIKHLKRYLNKFTAIVTQCT